jgi:hypothetical protein
MRLGGLYLEGELERFLEWIRVGNGKLETGAEDWVEEELQEAAETGAEDWVEEELQEAAEYEDRLVN